MNMQVTSKMARFGSRLVTIGQRHRELESRIDQVEKDPQPDELVLRRLKREKLRLDDEMHCYDGLLRTLSRSLRA